MTIVVTGATGNVGRPLVQALVDAGEKCARSAANPARRPCRPAWRWWNPPPPAVVTDDVEKILGRPTTTFEQWVSEHRSLFTQ